MEQGFPMFGFYVLGYGLLMHRDWNDRRGKEEEGKIFIKMLTMRQLWKKKDNFNWNVGL